MAGKRKAPPHRLREKSEPIRAVLLNIHGMAPTLDLLNRLIVWDGRIEFVQVERKGPMLIAKTSTDAWVIWSNMEELNCFSKSQAIIADATGILIPTPPQGEIRFQWEQAVDTLLRLAGPNRIQLEPPLKEEIRYLLDLAWTAAGQPQARTVEEFIDFLRAIKRVPRDPALTPGAVLPTGAIERIPPVVFLAEDLVWVHVPCFRIWLSIPALLNRQPLLMDVRNGLVLLGFDYHKSLARGSDGDREMASMWSGPLDALTD